MAMTAQLAAAPDDRFARAGDPQDRCVDGGIDAEDS